MTLVGLCEGIVSASRLVSRTDRVVRISGSKSRIPRRQRSSARRKKIGHQAMGAPAAYLKWPTSCHRRLGNLAHRPAVELSGISGKIRLSLVTGLRGPVSIGLAEIILPKTSREDFDYAHAHRTATPMGLRTRTMGMLLRWPLAKTKPPRRN
jgi:hypothetical protein